LLALCRFAHMLLHHVDSTKMTNQLRTSQYSRAICCPASHFANLLQAKKSVVTALGFEGSSTPLTAIKACLKLIGSQLTSLSLRGEPNVNINVIKEVAKQCPGLTYLDLNCSAKGLSESDEDAMIEAMSALEHIKTLRLAPFGPFNNFIGDWPFVKGCRSYTIPSIEMLNMKEEVNVYYHDFCEGTESDIDMSRMRFNKLRRLQSLLPRDCKLTNNGKWTGSGFLSESWGTKFKEDVAEWHVFGARSYQQMKTTYRGEESTANGSDGSTIYGGLIKTVWLQCGDLEELAVDGQEVKRFYTSAEDWHAANPVFEEEKPLGPVIET